MDQLFSSNASVSLEKQIDKCASIVKTNPEDIDEVYDIARCVKWVQNNGYKKVCLQFPDYLLTDASKVAFHLQNGLGFPVYVLGDTAYESCCVDYVAAAHVDADAIIHFGPVCFSTADDKIPCLFVYEKYIINETNISDLLNKFQNAQMQSSAITVLVDTQYIHKIDDIRLLLKDDSDFVLVRANELNAVKDMDVCVFIGESCRKLMNIACLCSGKLIYYLDPRSSNAAIEPYSLNTAILKRRNYLIEKIKDSRTIGIVIGTVAVKNYLQVIERIKKLCKLNGKKHYIISVGKPTVAKLANFPEIDIYAVISCVNSEIYENRDFYKPIVTPYDVEVALNPKARQNQFSYDYNLCLVDGLDDLTEADFPESDVSLLTGNVRSVTSHYKEMLQTSDAVAVRNRGTVALEGSNHGAGYLAERTWKGLEQNVGSDEVTQVTEGRKGIAQSYENEML